MKSCSHFQITTSEPLGLQSAGGEATAPAAAWGASRTGSAELIAVIHRELPHVPSPSGTPQEA